MKYYISDLHFGHANIIKLCDRPFANILEMDEALIANWNARVTNGDEVYIIGDLFFRAADNLNDYLARCTGSLLDWITSFPLSSRTRKLGRGSPGSIIRFQAKINWILRV